MWFIRCPPLRRVSWMNICLALLRDRERVDEGKDAPKCVGASLSLRTGERWECGLPKMRWSFTRFVLKSGRASAGTEFRNCAPGRWGLGLQLLGRMGEWSWLAAAGPAWVGGVPGPAGLSRPVYGAARGPSALPSAITLTFASRSGSSSGALVLGCSLGSLAFEPCPSSAFVRRGPPGGKTYAYPEGHPHW